MSTNSPHPSSVYIGAIIAIVAISTLGVLLRITAIRRARANAMNLARPAVYSARPQSTVLPVYNSQPARPASTYTPGRPARQPTWSTPAPPYTPPRQPSSPTRPASPPSNPRQPASPPSFPIPQPAPAPSPSTPNNPPVDVHFPTPSPSPNTSTQPVSLMERMREVQTLMLEIHRLESDSSGANNRARIQELQQRVTELSNVDGQGTVAEANLRAADEPPPYGLDGRAS